MASDVGLQQTPTSAAQGISEGFSFHAVRAGDDVFIVGADGSKLVLSFEKPYVGSDPRYAIVSGFVVQGTDLAGLWFTCPRGVLFPGASVELHVHGVRVQVCYPDVVCDIQKVCELYYNGQRVL